MAGSKPSTNRERLDSWKEIAVFFGRDERTVSRWEKELGLPVHRLPGAKGRVYAYTDELSAWLASPRNDGGELPGQNVELRSDSEPQSGRFTVIAGRHPLSDQSSEPTDPREVAAPPAAPSRKLGLSVAAALILVAALALLLFRHPNPAL